MLTLPSAVRIFLRAEPTDMRCGFNKLCMLTEHLMGQDPFSGHLFVFFNRRGDKCKILFWDRTGFCLWYKRLEEGTFQTPPGEPGRAAIEVDIARLTWILEGIDLFRTRCRKRYQRPANHPVQ